MHLRLLSLTSFVLLANLATADPPTDEDALQYAGSYEGAAPGAPVSVAFYSTDTGGSAVCGPQAANVLGVRFELTLPRECAEAVRANRQLFVQVTVSGTMLPRKRLRSVPYAIESSVSAVAKRVVLDGGARPISGTGVVCGAEPNRTGNVTEAGLTGYRAVKALCERVCNSPSAHICTAHEATLSASVGNPPVGRFSSGVTPLTGGTGIFLTDCDGFTSASAQRYGAFWFLAAPGPDVKACNTPDFISCCD